jgi:hypothetical protein
MNEYNKRILIKNSIGNFAIHATLLKCDTLNCIGYYKNI